MSFAWYSTTASTAHGFNKLLSWICSFAFWDCIPFFLMGSVGECKRACSKRETRGGEAVKLIEKKINIHLQKRRGGGVLFPIQIKPFKLNSLYTTLSEYTKKKKKTDKQSAIPLTPPLRLRMWFPLSLLDNIFNDCPCKMSKRAL